MAMRQWQGGTRPRMKKRNEIPTHCILWRHAKETDYLFLSRRDDQWSISVDLHTIHEAPSNHDIALTDEG
jgi:hypothetical protein